MGLYDNRLAELSEPARRSSRRVARRGSAARSPNPAFARPSRPSTPASSPRPFEPGFSRERAALGEVRYGAPVLGEAKRRPPTDVQSLLFSRADGWTAGKAKQWAKSRGYKHGKVDVTDQYVRIRQFDPKGLKIKRTIPFGQGIKAVVAREETSMATATKESRRRRPARKGKAKAAKEAPRRRRRTTREVPAAVAAPRRRRARRTREAPAAVAAPRRRRARRTREAPAAVAAPRRRRRRAAAPSRMMESPRRRRPSRRRRAAHRTREAWHGDRAGHRKAAKKGAARRKRAGRRTRESVMAESPRRRRRPRRTREEKYVMASPRRRRRGARRSAARTHESPRRYRRSGKRGNPFSGAELALALGTGALGFILADGLDRFLATYDPTVATKPTDRFTSDGAGTLANALNVASTPTLLRGGVALGMAIAPLVGSMFVDQPYVRSSLEGFGIGAGIHAFKLLWNNVIMPLLKPADTSTAGLQKSFIARLYPAEVAAAINLAQTPPTQAVSSGGASGALSGAADVGPFALSAESQYPSAAEAMRRTAGMAGPGNQFPTLQNTWGTGDQFPTAAQAMGVGQAMHDATNAVMAALPGIPPAAAAQAAGAAIASPHNIHGALVMVLPHVPVHVLMECARSLAPHVARLQAAAAAAGPVATAPAPAGTSGLYGVGGYGVGQTPPAATGQPMSAPLTAVPSAPVPVGPPPLPVPGPRVQSPDASCGCVGDDNPFLGFIGDAEEDTLFSSRAA